ncbi:DUF423 domain-containing protein [Fluviispira multicolorata]|uniref:DUF423 domain-containing protein n=1 Tax=Fluviispira multicolorata TaxID=2654512 RepID=A0A833JEX2_9BACT|nr:DUF423 domain-containing protein [Fluviispira multicolorata]KAB8030654.1 DUF423 domain-containing protein [Fluviispira multicolorata]
MFYPKLFSVLGLLGVALGAFGAHGLKNKVSPEYLENWKTATLYLFIHILAGLISYYVTDKNRSQLFFAIGCMIFSGSLFLLVLLNLPILGAITPIGGVSFMLGWVFLFFDINKKKLI